MLAFFLLVSESVVSRALKRSSMMLPTYLSILLL